MLEKCLFLQSMKGTIMLWNHLPNKQKKRLRIAIIVAALLALAAIVIIVLIPKGTKSEIIVPKAKPAVSEEPIEWDRDSMMIAYGKEQARFAKVLSEASDEELFIVLNYAIANHYVPNMDIDPFYNVHVMVGHWQRSLMVYNNLSDRKDLLKKIYPDLKVLDEYVHWGRQSGTPYPDTLVSQKILNNVKQESRKMNSKLISKYFRTPLMNY